MSKNLAALVNKEDILKAKEKIQNEDLQLRDGTKFSVEIDGTLYPPKEIIRVAARIKGLNPQDYNLSGGNCNTYLERMGFRIINKFSLDDPIALLIKKYKAHISKSQLKDESYKWKLVHDQEGRPDTTAKDFEKELKEIDFSNLIYAMARAVANHIVKEKTEEFRSLFIKLFNEQNALKERLESFSVESLSLYRDLEGELSHHQDERTMAAYLTFHNPEKYTFYKSTFYKKYCALLGVKPAKKNSKYVHYIDLVNDLISDYIEPDIELQKLVKSYIPDYYNGTNNLLLAQDILYYSFNKGIEEDAFNYKEPYTKWLHSKSDEKSNKASSYIRALEILSLKIENDVFTIDNTNYLNELYADLIDNQTDKEGKYYYAEAPSYGEGKYFSAACKSYIEFLEWQELKTRPMNKNSIPLNQILFGPPGTGKTYHTVDLAVQIAEPIKYQREEHSKNKKTFDQLVNDGRIVFTTFHQSMSYEDFVEGIKPKLDDENQDTRYTIEDGIFKKIAQNAREVSTSSTKVDWDNPNYFKMSLGGKSRVDLHNWCIENNFIGLGWGSDRDLSPLMATQGWYEYRDQFNKLFPDLVENSRFHIQACYAFQHSMQEGDIVVITKGNHIIDAIGIIEGPYVYDDSKPIDFYHYRKVKWITTKMNVGPEKFFEKNISQVAIYQFDKSDLKTEAFKAITSSKKKANDEPYILIIDEINRGNISQIFGELITLIEEDKREGADNEIKVKLPYSKDSEPPFSVPKNLYIIGTMNTADRSVEALDSALRRRFSFKEMMPQPERLKDLSYNGIEMAKLLRVINERIEVLVDRDHTIGHSYFMKLSDSADFDADLRRIFKDNIIPLLQEYFFNDYGKIQLVLGKGFIERKPNQTLEFADAETDIETEDYKDKAVYQIVEPNNLEMALNQLFGKTEVQDVAGDE